MRLAVSAKLAPCSRTPFDAVYGQEVVATDANWFESYAPDAFVLQREGARVQLGHDSQDIGSVVVVAPGVDGWHHIDFLVDSDDPAVLARVRTGTPVSLGGQEIAADRDYHLRTRRITRCELEHLAVCREGERPAFEGAVIIRAKPQGVATSSADWRRKLPSGFADYANLSDETVVHDRYVLTNHHGSVQWDGDKFVSVGRPIAA